MKLTRIVSNQLVRVFFKVRVTLSGINHIVLASELKAKPLLRSRWLILHDSTGWLSAAALTFKYEICDGADCVHWGASGISDGPSLPAAVLLAVTL
jgi:hypothetical protein